MKIQRILAPIDFSMRSVEELRWAIGFAREHEAELTTLYVLPLLAIEDALMKGKDVESLRTEALAELQQLVGQMAKDLSFSGLKHAARVAAGDPAEEIVAAAKREKIDLIVIATHGRSGLPRAFLGSITEKVVRLSPVPVLTLSQAAMARAA